MKKSPIPPPNVSIEDAEHTRKSQIKAHLNKIQQLMDQGNTSLVKEALSDIGISYSSLRNWLRDHSKAFSSYDVKKGLLEKLAGALPRYEDMRKSEMYKFLLEESGGDLNEQATVRSFIGTYKVKHNFPDNIKVRPLRILYNEESNFPFFYVTINFLHDDGTATRRPSDGFVYLSRDIIIFSGIEKKADVILHAKRPFDINKDIFQGVMTIYFKEIGAVFTSCISLYKMDNESKEGINMKDVSSERTLKGGFFEIS